MTRDELHIRVEADYRYVRDAKKQETFDEIRIHAKALAHLFIDTVPPGRELECALQKIEEACMHASAAIARRVKDQPTT